MADVAAAAAAAREALARRLAPHLDLRPAAGPPAGVAHRAPAAPPAPSLDLAAFAALPPELLPSALALLHRAAGLPYPPPAAARAELARQLAARAAAPSAAHRPLAADAGRGWCWRQEGGRLVLRRGERGTSAAGFSYKLAVPGVLEIPEAGLAVRVGLEPPAPWMLRGSRRRAALDLPLVPGDRVVVRSRRPGDRLRPLGSAGTRRLKDLLIDHRVPREQRDRLPLLCLGRDGAEIAWVPGVTIADRHRLDPAAAAPVWVAEIVAAPASAEAGASVSPDVRRRGNRPSGATVGRSEVTTQ
jgi:tRNA(Ile)-lysidine synthetase-like protein